MFEGGAGMEYPMMVNDGSYPDTAMARFVAEHEIAHTYMPFYMGIDETRYAFMDEGWATTFEYLIGSVATGHGGGGSVLPTVPGEPVDPRHVRGGGPAHHHPGRRAHRRDTATTPTARPRWGTWP